MKDEFGYILVDFRSQLSDFVTKHLVTLMTISAGFFIALTFDTQKTGHPE
jgi:hypothetical protein